MHILDLRFEGDTNSTRKRTLVEPQLRWPLMVEGTPTPASVLGSIGMSCTLHRGRYSTQQVQCSNPARLHNVAPGEAPPVSSCWFCQMAHSPTPPRAFLSALPSQPGAVNKPSSSDVLHSAKSRAYYSTEASILPPQPSCIMSFALFVRNAHLRAFTPVSATATLHPLRVAMRVGVDALQPTGPRAPPPRRKASGSLRSAPASISRRTFPRASFPAHISESLCRAVPAASCLRRDSSLPRLLCGLLARWH